MQNSRPLSVALIRKGVQGMCGGQVASRAATSVTCPHNSPLLPVRLSSTGHQLIIIR